MRDGDFAPRQDMMENDGSRIWQECEGRMHLPELSVNNFWHTALDVPRGARNPPGSSQVPLIERRVAECLKCYIYLVYNSHRINGRGVVRLWSNR